MDLNMMCSLNAKERTLDEFIELGCVLDLPQRVSFC